MTCNLELTYNDDRWATIISPDQEGCNKYLHSIEDQLKGKDVLHVGIGNSSVYREFGHLFNSLLGITIMQSEWNVAERLIYESHPTKQCIYSLSSINKYDPRSTESLDKYDIIIDNNLKMHACCHEHWLGYWNCLNTILKVQGKIITHTQGFAPHTDKITALSIEELKHINYKNLIITEHKELKNEYLHYPISLTYADPQTYKTQY